MACYTQETSFTAALAIHSNVMCLNPISPGQEVGLALVPGRHLETSRRLLLIVEGSRQQERALLKPALVVSDMAFAPQEEVSFKLQ